MRANGEISTGGEFCVAVWYCVFVRIYLCTRACACGVFCFLSWACEFYFIFSFFYISGSKIYAHTHTLAFIRDKWHFRPRWLYFYISFLQTLQWNLLPPTVLSWLNFYLKKLASRGLAGIEQDIFLKVSVCSSSYKAWFYSKWVLSLLFLQSVYMRACTNYLFIDRAGYIPQSQCCRARVYEYIL